MWSTVYVSQKPGKAPLASVGAFVRAGQVLAVLEVMKHFYNLESPVSGRVIAVHFTDGAVVEEGMVLFDIEVSQ